MTEDPAEAARLEVAAERQEAREAAEVAAIPKLGPTPTAVEPIAPQAAAPATVAAKPVKVGQKPKRFQRRSLSGSDKVGRGRRGRAPEGVSQSEQGPPPLSHKISDLDPPLPPAQNLTPPLPTTENLTSSTPPPEKTLNFQGPPPTEQISTLTPHNTVKELPHERKVPIVNAPVLGDVVIEEKSDIRYLLERGKVKEVALWLVDRGDPIRAPKVLAEIGNENQIWSYQMKKGQYQFTTEVRGWQQILVHTGLGVYREPSGKYEVWAVMTDGGRSHTNVIEGVKLILGVYMNGENMTLNKPIKLEDVESWTREHPKGKRKRKYERSALQKLLPLCQGLNLTAKTTTEVAWAIPA